MGMRDKMTILAIATGLSATAGPVVWVEGESALRTRLVANAGLEAVDKEELSGSVWIASFSNGDQPAGTAEFDVAVPPGGTFRLWARGTGELACSVEGGEWNGTAGKPYADHMEISADGNPGFPTLGWFDLGEVALTAGSRRFVWRLGAEKGEKRYGALDCFVLASGDFRPSGQFKPGETPVADEAFAQGGSWAFTPEPDAFATNALLDLRGLNEPVAGEHGFVGLSADGESFLRGDGQPIRFWAAGLRTTYRAPSLEEMRRRARFLAKRGVNLVRIFAMLPPDKPGTPVTEVNERELDAVFRLVAACKESGIYTVVCGYWGTHTKRQPGWELMDSGRDNLGGLVYIDPRAREAYRHWMRALLDRPNPHTGLRLADDPSVAIVQLQNEDNLLWWDFAGIKGEALESLRREYADFLRKKHGSLENAFAAWQGYAAGFPPDDRAAGLPGFLHIWDLTRDGTDQKSSLPGFSARSADQLEFIARLMRRFNEETILWMRNDLRVKSLINCGNWQTIDMTATQDAQYWADSAGEVMARNAYAGGRHVGINNGWQILVGHRYEDKSMLLDPRALPTNVRQTAGRPFFLPEVLWSQPGLFQAESALLMAAQQSIGGVDAGCWFSNYPDEWAVGGDVKWTFSTPMQMGMFPAAALIHRLGMLKPAAPAVVDARPLDRVWARTTPLTSEDPGFDPNRHANIPKTSSRGETDVDPLAYLAGGVRVVFGGDPAQSSVVDLAPYIDAKAKTVRAITGEAALDYGTGVFRIDAPLAQGAVGFLGAAGPQRLGAMRIDCRAPYAAVVAVSLDGKPLRETSRALVQVGTVARPTGWRTRPARLMIRGDWTPCRRIVSLGAAPWRIGSIGGTIEIANPGLTSAVALDPNGMPMDAPVTVRQTADGVSMDIPNGTLYVLLSSRRDGPIQPSHP